MQRIQGTFFKSICFIFFLLECLQAKQREGEEGGARHSPHQQERILLQKQHLFPPQTVFPCYPQESWIVKVGKTFFHAEIKRPSLWFITLDTLKERVHITAPLFTKREIIWTFSLRCLHILRCLETIITAAAAASQSETTRRKCLIVSCETTSCKSHRIIAAITVTVAIIAVPTVRCHCHWLLGIKFTINSSNYIDPRAQIACFNAPGAHRFRLRRHAPPPTLNHSLWQ